MSAYHSAKRAALHAMRLCGVFSACERLTAHGLQILCYHGMSVADEHLFMPKLFMRPRLFAARMDWLARAGYRAVGLEEAVQGLNEHKLPHRSVVLTFDDGWYGCLAGAFEKLAAMRWPATLYVTTYYAEKRCPVFNVAVEYVLRRSRPRILNLRELSDCLSGHANLASPKERASACERISAFGNEHLELSQRMELLYRLTERMGLDPLDLFERRRVATLMDLDELKRAVSLGIDLQLHTHRHRFPVDDDEMIRRELADNRATLAANGGRDLHHLCYPSGEYHSRAFSTLREAGVKTATTTKAGLNFPCGEPLALTRFLDGENIGAIEFRGEIAGVGELFRQFRAGRPPWSSKSPLHWRQPGARSKRESKT